MKLSSFALVFLFFIPSIFLSAQCLNYEVIPDTFDFQNIDPNLASTIWEIRHCHDLQGLDVTLPPNVILHFREGQLTNFNNLVGNLTGIEASSKQIFDVCESLTGTWLVEHVNVAWFGARPDGSDSSPAFEKATDFFLGSNIRKMIIPPGNYHLQDFWMIRHPNGGNPPWNHAEISGYGAILDHTVVVRTKALSLKGITVRKADNEGFVFIRGQGAHHEHLLADSCGTNGFYCGIGSIDGNDEGEYGTNSQVTRSVFSGLIARRNGGHGWLLQGYSSQNKSWFNANLINGFASVGNAGKGLTWEGNEDAYNDTIRINYNTFNNLNCEGNGDIAVDLPLGRANTFIGGHYVDKDTSGYVFRTQNPFNFNFGGRYVGDIQGSHFVYANTNHGGEGGIIGRVRAMDDIAVKEMEITKEPYIALGWSILPEELQEGKEGTDANNTQGHGFAMDLSPLPNADQIMLRVTRFGKRNFSGGANQKYAYSLLINITRNTNGVYHLDWNRLSDDQNCTVNSVALDNTSLGKVVISFDTTHPTFGTGIGVVEYRDVKEKDFR